MVYQSSSGLDHLGLNTRQRPVIHRLRQGQPAQEVAQVVGQYEQCEPDLVGYELVAGQPGPVQGLFTFLDPLLRRAATVVEMHYPFGWVPQVGDDEAHPGK